MLLGVIANHHRAEGLTSLLESMVASKLIEQLHLKARVCIKALAHASLLDLMPPWLVDIVQKEVGDSVDASAMWDHVLLACHHMGARQVVVQPDALLRGPCKVAQCTEPLPGRLGEESL